MQSVFFLKRKFSLILLTGLVSNRNPFLALVKSLALFFVNKINRTGSFAIFMLFCMNSLVQAQVDPQFSQYMFNPLAINPGFAGINGRINAVVVDRHQWVGLEGAPRTTVVGADMALNFLGNPGGAGLVIMNDQIGFYRNITIQALVAQKFDIGEGQLGVGISFGMFNMVFDGTKAIPSPDGGTYHNPNDDLVPGTEVNATSFDTGIGVYYKHDKIYGGISVLHLFEPKPNFNEEFPVYIPRSFFITGGYNHALWEYPLVLKPSFLLKGVGSIWQFDLNISAVYRDKFWGGLS